MTKRFRAPPASRASDKASSGSGGKASAHGAAAPAAQAGGKSGGGRPSPSRTPDGYVVVAEFGRAHGIRGEVRLKSWTQDPAAVADYGPLTTADGMPMRLANVRLAPGGEADMFVVQVDGVNDRTAAEALARQRLYVPRDRLPTLDDEDEFYLTDLVGLVVEDLAGQHIGDVVAVHDFGAGDVVEIRPVAGQDAVRRGSVMVAFTRSFVPTVDILARRLVVAANPFEGAEDGAGEGATVDGEPRTDVTDGNSKA